MRKNECQYAEPEILAELKIEGLRLARFDEDGSYWKAFDSNDEQVILWVTEA